MTQNRQTAHSLAGQKTKGRTRSAERVMVAVGAQAPPEPASETANNGPRGRRERPADSGYTGFRVKTLS